MYEEMMVRHAVLEDAEAIHALIQVYAEEKLLLPRTLDDLRLRYGNFKVGILNGRIICCVALRDYGESLYEVRSLAVAKEFAGGGIGSRLVQGAIDLLKREKAPCRVFALTYRANFFCRLGFRIVEKELFPQKIWSDCSICPKATHCDETAVLMEIC